MITLTIRSITCLNIPIMAETLTLGPLSNFVPGRSSSWGQAIRLHRNQAGSSVAFTVSANRRNTWYNCFDSSQIPEGATIDGVELVLTGSTSSNAIGTAGSTGANEEATYNIRLYNGTAYSNILYTNTFVGGNDYYGGTLGGPNDLSGLSWADGDQADFGFDIEVSSVVGTPIAIASRGCALKVYYTDSQEIAPISGIQSKSQRTLSQIQSINGVSTALIRSINQRG